MPLHHHRIPKERAEVLSIDAVQILVPVIPIYASSTSAWKEVSGYETSYIYILLYARVASFFHE